ncbi:DUF2514 family protein [Herbaspirillum sp. ST 5-3]|uniref:DUF2514 family protein n=1 Tax=Oxalobacteraceae TaxID=75682 RepID=UPI0010A49202|nr:DUF2514 family protein [Herbaspirillum sp. ST 5-3]
MYLRLAIAAVVAVLLAGSHWKAYVMGGDAVRVEWQADKMAQADATAAINESYRLKERAMSKQLEEARNEATKRETAIRTDADRARKSADSLRDELASIREQLPSLAVDAVRQRADTLARVLDECQQDYRGMAETADRLESDRQTLMDAWPK